MSQMHSTNPFLDLLEASVRADERRALDALPNRPAKPRGRVQTHIGGTQAQLNLLNRWLTHVPEKRREPTRRFLVHLLASTPAAFRRNDLPEERLRGYVPIYSKFIEKHFRGADWKSLEKAGLLSVRPYNRLAHRSNEFKVAREHWRAFLEAGVLTSGQTDGGRVDLASGKPTTRRTKSDLTLGNGNPLPSLVRAAIDAIGPTPFNRDSIRNHLEQLRRRVDEAPAGSQRAEQAARRYLNDLTCCAAVLSQGAEPGAGGLWEYQPAYRMQRFGRISQKGGGLQSCSRAMKTAAYTGVLDLVNLDLKSSQARILIAEMEEAGIEATWLRRYGNHPEGKHEAARYVGISVNAWKAGLYATLMGARVTSPRQVAYSEGAIKKTILRDVGPKVFDTAYERFLRLTADLHAEIARWHAYLVTDHVEQHGRRNNVDGKTYLRNQVGAAVALENLSEAGEPHVLKARLAAFYLQGREAAFTHTLAGSSREYGFRVVSHEHDGLVVIGNVPLEAVEAAAAAARLPLALVDLEPKPFE